MKHDSHVEPSLFSVMDGRRPEISVGDDRQTSSQRQVTFCIPVSLGRKGRPAEDGGVMRPDRKHRFCMQGLGCAATHTTHCTVRTHTHTHTPDQSSHGITKRRMTTNSGRARQARFLQVCATTAREDWHPFLPRGGARVAVGVGRRCQGRRHKKQGQ